MGTALQPSTARTASRLLGAVAALVAIAAATALLFPAPLADAFFAGWVLVALLLALVGGVGAWTDRTPLVWAAALLLTGLSVVGMWSVGLFVAPAAVALLGSALLQWRSGAGRTERNATVPDSPSIRETVLKIGAGTGAVLVGGLLVYLGAIARDLFGACSRETLSCALARTHWDAVGTTTLGLLAVGLGGWLLWRRVALARGSAPSEA